jgi:hypothetical protein
MEAKSSTGAERRRRLDRRGRELRDFGGPERRRSMPRRLATVRRGHMEVGALQSKMLLPANGYRFLSPLRVVARIESEFAYVESDDEEGRRYVETMIDEIRSNRRGRTRESDDERIAQLEGLKNKAVHVRFGDDPGSEDGHLSLTVVPGEPLIVVFDPGANAAEIQSLVKRCAKALGYSIIRPSTDAQ